MSKIESINCIIKENIQKIEISKLKNDKNNKVDVIYLKMENIRLNNLLNNLKKNKV